MSTHDELARTDYVVRSDKAPKTTKVLVVIQHNGVVTSYEGEASTILFETVRDTPLHSMLESFSHKITVEFSDEVIARQVDE